MFYPQEMTEVELVVPEKHILHVISFLAKYGVFHQTDTSYLSSDAGLDSARDWRSKSSTYASLEHRLLAAMKILEIDEGDPPTEELSALTDVDAVSPTATSLEQEVQAVIEELTSEQKEMERLLQLMHQLQPIEKIGISLDSLYNLRYLFGMIGIMPADNVERLKTSLVRIPFVLLTLEQNQEQAVVLLCGPRQNADILERAARSAYLNPLNLPEEYHGTPHEILEEMQIKVDRLKEQIEDQKATLAELRQTRKDQFQNLFGTIDINQECSPNALVVEK